MSKNNNNWVFPTKKKRKKKVTRTTHYLTEKPTSVRDCLLITGRGGLQNGRGGHVKFYPYEKGGRKKF